MILSSLRYSSFGHEHLFDCFTRLVPFPADFNHRCGFWSIAAVFECRRAKKLALPSQFDMRFSGPAESPSGCPSLPADPLHRLHFGAGLLREALMLADLCPNAAILYTSSTNRWMLDEGLDRGRPSGALSICWTRTPAVWHRFELFFPVAGIAPCSRATTKALYGSPVHQGQRPDLKSNLERAAYESACRVPNGSESN